MIAVTAVTNIRKGKMAYQTNEATKPFVHSYGIHGLHKDAIACYEIKIATVAAGISIKQVLPTNL